MTDCADRVVSPPSMLADEHGATAIEYALIASLIAMAIIGSLSATGNSVSGGWGNVSSRISAAIDGVL